MGFHIILVVGDLTEFLDDGTFQLPHALTRNAHHIRELIRQGEVWNFWGPITSPLVLAVTFLGMSYWGIGLHKIPLGSLIISLGLLVAAVVAGAAAVVVAG